MAPWEVFSRAYSTKTDNRDIPMKTSDRGEAIFFVFWGLGVLGAGILLMVTVDIVRFMLFQKEILWLREMAVLIFGIVCLSVSWLKLRKTEE